MGHREKNSRRAYVFPSELCIIPFRIASDSCRKRARASTYVQRRAVIRCRKICRSRTYPPSACAFVDYRLPEFLHVPCEDCALRGIREVEKVGTERFRAMRNDFPI
jgi:hypothetical protein